MEAIKKIENTQKNEDNCRQLNIKKTSLRVQHVTNSHKVLLWIFTIKAFGNLSEADLSGLC